MATDIDIQKHLGIQLVKTAKRHDVDPLDLRCRDCGLTKTAILFHCVNECRPHDHSLAALLKAHDDGRTSR